MGRVTIEENVAPLHSRTAALGRDSRIKLRWVGELLDELPSSIDRQFDRGLVARQCLDLLGPGHRWLLVEVGLMQHRHPLRHRVAGNQRDVLFRNTLVM